METMQISFGMFVVLTLAGIIIVGLAIGRLFRPREDPYAIRGMSGPSSLGVPVDPDEQAMAAATAIRIKSQRDRKFAAELRSDSRAALLAAGVPEAQLDPVLKKLGEMANDADQRVERRIGTLMMDWHDKSNRRDD